MVIDRLSGELKPLRDDRPTIDEAADQWRLIQGDLTPGESVLLTIRSGSMLPIMPVGDRIAVIRADGQRCEVGDVVVFRQGDRLVAHRLVFGWGPAPVGCFLQRGDGFSPVGIVRARSILGRVVAVHAADGTVRELTGREARWRARRAARRSLTRTVRDLATGPLRKVRQWLT